MLLTFPTNWDGEYEIPLCDADEFLSRGKDIAHYSHDDKTSWKIERFHKTFGVEPKHVAIAWSYLVESGYLHNRKFQPNPTHLLWAFLFMKSYDTQCNLAAACGCKCRETFRKWKNFYLEGVAGLERWIVSCFWHVLLFVYYLNVPDSSLRSNGKIDSKIAMVRPVLLLLTELTFRSKNNS